jgi:RecA-family ATPase
MLDAAQHEQLTDYDRPVRVSEIKSELVKWIVPGWIPSAKISILYGDPGLGKSLVTLDLAARITSGEPMPLCETPHPPSSVLLFCAEP